MSKINCSACDELREKAAEFVVNGVSSSVCTSLKNNTGFNPSNSNNNETDLNNANDCLIGNMADEVDAYEVCNWKDFMKKFIPNLREVIKALICGISGMWTLLQKLQCQLNFAFKGVSKTYTRADFIPGIGVELKSSAQKSAEPTVRIRGNTVHVQGSLTINLKGTYSGYDMKDYWGRLGFRQIGGENKPPVGQEVADPHMAVDQTNYYEKQQKGIINTPNGNWRIAIIPIKKSDMPQVGIIRTGVGMFNNAACGLVTLQCVDGDAQNEDDREYQGYWGYGTPGGDTVPSGYYYLVLSLSNLITWGITGKDGDATVTFDVFTQCEINPAKIDC